MAQAAMGSVLYNHALLLLLIVGALVLVTAVDPSPKPWPEQFHAQIFMNTTGQLSVVDLWYDWPNGRNFNIIQSQLGSLLYDLEWTNGTSYFYDLDAKSCYSLAFPVGVLRPDWLVDNSHYLGVREVDGFKCNVWEKEDFITYYEDVETRKPVHWLFFNGMSEHVMTFEEGRVLEDQNWQAPPYCFVDADEEQGHKRSVLEDAFIQRNGLDSSLQPWTRNLARIPR